MGGQLGQALRSAWAGLAWPPCPPSPPLPYDEVKVGTSKHKQTQQSGDSPIGHWGERVLQGPGSPQVPAALGGQEALGEQSGPRAAPRPATASPRVPNFCTSVPGGPPCLGPKKAR